MATKLEELFIEMNARSEKLEAGMNKSIKIMKESQRKISKSAEKTHQTTKKSFLGISNAATLMAGIVGGGLVLGGLNKLRGAFFESFRGAIELSKGLAEINTILPRNEQLTKDTTNQLIEFSRQFGTKQRSQTKAFYDIVSAGIKGTVEQLITLQVANDAAVAGLVDVSVSADVLTSAMNAYANAGLTAEQASDALFAAVVAGKTTFGELASTIGQVAPIAAAVGLKFSELTGSIAQLTKTGLSTAEAVTGLKSILTAVVKPGEQAQKTAKKIGLEFNTAAIRAKGFAGFLVDLAEKTKGSDSILAKLIPNVRGLGSILAVVKGDIEGFKDVLESTENSMGATKEAAKIMKKELDFKLDVLIANFKSFGVAIAGFFTPAIKKGVDAANSLFQILKNPLTFFIKTKGLDLLNDLITEQDQKLIDVNKRLASYQAILDSGTISSGKGTESIKKRIDSLKEERAELEKNAAFVGPQQPGAPKQAGKETGGAAASLVAETREFTAAQKEAATAGVELTKALDEQALAGGTRAKQALATSQDALEQELISVQEHFDLKQSIMEERQAAEQDQLNAALDQDKITKEQHNSALLELDAKQATEEDKLNRDRRKKQQAFNKKKDQEDLKNREAFLNAASTLSNAKNKELAFIGKAAAITQIAIKTPPAVASSFEFGSKLGGPIGGAIAAGIAAVAMSAQAAQIAGVPLARGITKVPAGFPNDSFPARLQSGEGVIDNKTNPKLNKFLDNPDSGMTVINNNTFNIQVDAGSEEAGIRTIDHLNTVMKNTGARFVA